jgi:hypothetical protein
MDKVQLSFQTALFSGPDADVYSEIFVNFGVALYESVMPDFGWADLDQPGGHTWFDHVDALAIPHLYWANFFGPSYVQRIGRDVIKSALSWQVRELRDGGLLCVVSPVIGHIGAHHRTQAIMKVLNPDNDLELPNE